MRTNVWTADMAEWSFRPLCIIFINIWIRLRKRQVKTDGKSGYWILVQEQAGTALALAEEGYDVTAVELVKHNLGRLKQKCSLVKAYQGNALKLKRFEPESLILYYCLDQCII